MRDPQNITTGAVNGAYSIGTGSAFEAASKGCAAQVLKAPVVTAPTCAAIKTSYFNTLSECGLNPDPVLSAG
jgi:hypothetical protein